MGDSILSKRRRWCCRGSSDDFIRGLEDMVAPLDVLLGGGLDALTSEDVVKEIFLPDPAATAAAVAAKAGEKSKAPDREEKIGELGAKPGRNDAGGNARISLKKPTNAPPVASAAKTNAPPSASVATKKTKKKNRKRMLDETAVAEPNEGVMAGQSAASPPPLSAPLAGRLECPQRSSAPAPPATSAAKTNAPPSTPATTKKKQNRKRMIDETTVAEPKEGDVLSGRGGGTNVHPGNVRFRKKALELWPCYKKSSKVEKKAIAGILVEFVRSSGNRFLKKGEDGLWHEMIGKGPHLKASQAFRDIRGRNGD